MTWKREVIEEGPYNGLSEILLIILTAASLFFQFYPGAGIFLLCIAYFRIHKWYLENIGKELKIRQLPKRIRLHPEEKGNWEIHFDNEGMPLWGAVLRLTFKDIVEPADTPFETYHGGNIEVSIPFSMGRGESGKVSLPIVGKRRGLCRLTKVQILIPHLFGSGKVLMDLMEPVKSTVMVFPTPAPVLLENNHDSHDIGEVPALHSLFYDVFQPIGTREYVPGDRFQDIHWKASARTQVLQTKVFAPAVKKEWMIAVNLSEKYSITRDLEKIIKHTAFLMHLAAGQQISFSLVVNIRSQGITPFYYLPSGTGRKHQQRALEMLSALSTDDSTIPFHIVLQHLSIRQLVPSVLITAGILSVESEKRLSKIRAGHREIYSMYIEDKQGVVTIWKQRSKIPS
ncbi:hypothetical protein AS034_09335 [[Bacillus] enclensis]|uniref:Uncharacterized conserved protein, DUF58 family, contains vWF domain n=1 Tax=[Bacillus] enclensis TaxID=1402860 RepID=A0A0V8HI87_9BACI|nr:DUF58 domain-containing protein [[Bacillus] enclensis]KSU62319.1 hypothetical protein AS034_09335 [[Bacillus] enclensis]QTC42212.1 DUF58 domain-containing protein [Bacillus sp. V3]SCC02606.1 Uncharacterized conserved protein, DUF58 family, contains vWF domain [[Bacillus] enclensis]